MSSFTVLGFILGSRNVVSQMFLPRLWVGSLHATVPDFPRFPLSHCICARKHCLKFIEHLSESVLYLDVVLYMGCGLGIDNTQPETLGKGSYTYSELVYLCVSSTLLNFSQQYFILLCGFYIHPPLSTY
ncbi:hypothetical protein BDN70DRAFT_881602 [Pholiota conissans]|uniref:Uncharacterized protein n=1 Tax=Pholiota conissans TaxID=109636 RepID=A0A9P6CRI5_9AGAR|nr:hypothetical protein BDN70DRAFT_881602 [Pholiota conissans]